MKNSDYWKLRFEQLEAAQNGQGAAAVAEIERQYKEAQKQIEGQIARWYQRFADNNGISLAKARQYLKGAALKEFKWDVQDYIKYGQDNALMGGWTKELENASAKYHISKLEALKIQTQQSLEVMFSKQLETVTGAMSDVFESGYYHTAYELQKGFNIGWDIAGLDQSQIEKVLAKPWAIDGKNFSERIWGNKQKLISEVHGELTQNIMLGADPQKAIDSLAKKMKTSRYNAGRLIMTEEAYFSSAAQKDCFEELGVEQFEIVATLDSHTSDICRSLDGKHFPMKDYQPGVTAPPFHVFCRSTTVPYFDENFGDMGERAARDEETGKTYYVPDDMNYQKWKETFVEGGDKSGFDVVDDGSALHYKHHKEPELAPPPKKEYLTKKKLQAKIADADVQLEDLESKFLDTNSGLVSWKDFKTQYNGDYSQISYDADEEAVKKAIGDQIEAIEAQKAEWQEKLNEKLKAEQKKALIKQQISLEAEKAAVQQQLDDFEVKTYSGIWYGKDVTTADWGSLNIAGKKDYYENQIFSGKAGDKVQQFSEYIKQLEELDAEGSNYHGIQQQLKKIEAEFSKVQSDLKNLEKGDIIGAAAEEAFSQARKDAAMWAKSTKEADALLRDKCGEVWKAAKQVERRAIYDYTSGSGKFNRPLSGFQGGWGQYNNKGVGKVGLNYEGAFKEIKDMTKIISQSTYDFDVWLQRGCGTEAIESFLHLPNGTLGRMTHEQLQQFLGRDGRIYSFTSTGVAKGKGFSGQVIMNIYAPKGTQMMYAEPFSAFGNGGGKSWDGISPQSTFGYESEMIIQRGASYTITKIEKVYGTIFIDVEVHPEQGYEFVEDMADYVDK